MTVPEAWITIYPPPWGIYHIHGNVTAYELGPYAVSGDTAIAVGWNPWECDGSITISELQEAVFYWIQGTPVNGHIVVVSDLQEMGFQWLNP